MKKTEQNNLIIGCLCALGCETIFGLSYIFTKKATNLASEFSLLGWRFFIAALIMSILIMIGFIKVNLKGKPIKPLLFVALFNPCVYFIGETIGISNTTASESGVFLACIPVASLVASTFILKEKPSKVQTIGILITLLGVMVTVFAVGASTSLSFIGYAFLAIAVISYALYSVFVEKASDYTETEITYIMLLIGAIVFGTVAICEALINGNIVELITLQFKEKDFAVAILYQGIGSSILAFLLSNMAISKIGVNRTSSFIGVSTVVSIAAGAFLLKETFTIYQIVGAIIIIIGIYTANK
ncbi:DMT family transporter [Peptacetobacter sp.]|uniref:DMT family transporter n=1 Tax=Peptacetobacter sp. TaxID=2991975 RepID=UPI003AB51A28